MSIVERDGYAERSSDINIRVGMKSPPADGTGGDVEFTENKLCGIFIGPGQSGVTSIVNCDGKSQGFGRLEFFRFTIVGSKTGKTGKY